MTHVLILALSLNDAAPEAPRAEMGSVHPLALDSVTDTAPGVLVIKNIGSGVHSLGRSYSSRSAG